jgi:hypothetical protein
MHSKWYKSGKSWMNSGPGDNAKIEVETRMDDEW